MSNDKIRILFVGVNPDDTELLDLTKEAQQIDDELREAKLRDHFDLEQQWELAAVELPGKLFRFEPQILHFSGHGDADGELLFRGPDGRSLAADRETLGDLFELADGVRCVVLNACHSAEQAKEIARYVDVVIGMSQEVENTAAIAFAAGFYEALGFGKSVDRAFKYGKNRIGLSGDTDSKRVPQLYTRDGVDANKVILHDAVADHGSSDASTKPKIKILFLGANPIDSEYLDLTAEAQAIDDELRESDFRDDFDLEQQWDANLEELPGKLMRFKPCILHFSGHGGEEGKLRFRDAQGMAKDASPEVLTSLFAEFDDVQCAVLNACDSAMQAKLLSKHVGAVVGMSDAVMDAAAIKFSAGFYQALGYGKSLRTAFELAKIRIGLAGEEGGHVPRLFLREGVDASALFVKPT